jgi:hypothetical protein
MAQDCTDHRDIEAFEQFGAVDVGALEVRRARTTSSTPSASERSWCSRMCVCVAAKVARVGAVRGADTAPTTTPIRTLATMTARQCLNTRKNWRKSHELRRPTTSTLSEREDYSSLQK